MSKLIFLILLPTFAIGQPKRQVLDSLTRQPLPFATLRFLDQQARIARSGFTDSSGYFEWPTMSLMEVEISAIGYRTKNFSAEQNPYLLPTLTHTLSNLTITGQRQVINLRPDGFVYDATQDISIAGENGGDLLRKLPGVQVDPGGTPSMRGSTRIKVYIDGRPSETYAPTIADALRMIPANNIAKIEIITQPSARYEAEGVDGVLNIYTKRPLSDGSSGNIAGYYQNRAIQLTSYLAARKKQWIFTPDLGYYYNNSLNWTSIMRSATPSSEVEQSMIRTTRLTSLNGGIGITYLPDSVSTISIGYRFGKGWDNIYTAIDYSTPSDKFTRTIENPFSRMIHSTNWNYLRKTRNKKGEFSFLGNWFDQYIKNDFFIRQVGHEETNVNTTWNKELAVESNFSYVGFEAGVKAAFRRYRNTSDSEPHLNRSQDFTFPREIYGGYVSNTFSVRDFKIRIGARYEQTVLSLIFPDTSIRVPDYKNFLPNLLISRAIDAHSFSAAYSRKIFRPWLVSISPIIIYIDSFNLSYGNPNLDPAVSNNYDFTYSFIKKRWLISGNFFYYQTIKSIEAVAILKPTGIVERTYQNISENSASGLSIQLTYRAPNFNVNINNNLRYVDYGARNGWMNNFTANATLRIRPDFSVSGYVLLNGTRIDLQGYTTGTRYYNFAANKTFANGKYSLSLRLDNLFMHYQTITEMSKTESFTVTSENRQIRRFFRLGFNYKFGKKEIKVPTLRTISGDN
jgi:hypothetical protein